MYSTKKIKNCDRFRAIDQSTEMQAKTNLKNDCMNCKFFNNRNCNIESAKELDPLPGMWS